MLVILLSGTGEQDQEFKVTFYHTRQFKAAVQGYREGEGGRGHFKGE